MAHRPEPATVELTAVRPHPKNVRRGDVGAIVESIKAHGQYRPLVVQRSTGHVLAGNHTWRAAEVLGLEVVDVVYLDVDDDTALRIMLADNRTSDLATYDDEGLAELLRGLAEGDLGLTGTGFDGDDLDDLLFKLHGGPGTTIPGLTPAERADLFGDRGIRSLVLPWPEAKYVELVDLMRELRKRFGLESNADLVERLVVDATAMLEIVVNAEGAASAS